MTGTARHRRTIPLLALAGLFGIGLLLGQISRVPAMAAARQATALPTVVAPPTFPPLPGPTGDTPRPSATLKVAAPTDTPAGLRLGPKLPSHPLLPWATEEPTRRRESPDEPVQETATPTATTPPSPTNTAAPPPTPVLPPIDQVCSDPRRVVHLTLEAVPDVSGPNPFDAMCTGCDRYYGGADAFTAAGCPLPPLPYEITSPGRSGRILGIILGRGIYGVERRTYISLCDPGDKIIVTIQRPAPVNTCNYVLCPYSDQTYTRVIERRKIRQPRNGVTVTWFFWECEPLQPTNTPPPTLTPSSTPTNTPVTPSVTPTRTPTPIPTDTPTSTDTPAPTDTPTPTNTPVPPTATPTRTNTSVPPTATPTRTNTPAPPTATPTRTNTPAPPTVTPTRTNTPVPPTATPTPTNTPVPPTATPTRTNTPVPPTATPTRTFTPAPPTATPTRTFTPLPPTVTPTRTNTPVPPTATPTRTFTPVPPTATPTRTFTPVPPTVTPTRTFTPVPPTATPTRTFTPVPPTATPTRTNTPVPPTATPTYTNTPVPPSATATSTLVPSTNTPTPTFTPIPPTATPTPTDTSTPTNTPVPPTSTPTRTRTNTPVRPSVTPTRTPGTPGTARPPKPPPAGPGCNTSCLIIEKFNDLNANGIFDPGEPMLPGVRFDVQADNLIYPGTTDADGKLRMCFNTGTSVNIDELARATGGMWQMTTDENRMGVVLPCGDTFVWIGNALLGLPRTGDGVAGAHTQAGTARLY